MVEGRGLAGSPWKKEINNIAFWVRQYVKEQFQSGTRRNIRFGVPCDLTKKINFFRELSINGIALPQTECGQGAGRCEIIPPANSPQDTDVRNYTDCGIFIECYYNPANGQVFLQTILISLYHEINHMYEAYLDASKRNNFNRYRKSIQKKHGRILKITQ